MRTAAAVQDLVKAPPGFNELYRDFSDAVYRTALRVTGNPSDAEDVLQSVFLRIFTNQLTLDPMWSPEHYLRRAATNASIDLLRRRTSQFEVGIDWLRASGGKENIALLKEALRRALARLPQQDA